MLEVLAFGVGVGVCVGTGVGCWCLVLVSVDVLCVCVCVFFFWRCCLFRCGVPVVVVFFWLLDGGRASQGESQLALLTLALGGSGPRCNESETSDD